MMEQKTLQNNLKEYAKDDDDKGANAMLKGLMLLLEKQYKAGKVSEEEYTNEMDELRKALASP